MPRLNLKDEGLDAEGAPEKSTPPSPTPMLREVGGGGGKISPLVLIALIIVVLAGGVYALNHFKVIRLWGKKAPVVTETLPESEVPASTQTQEPPPGEAGTAAVATPNAGSETKSTAAATKEPSTPKAAATSAPAGAGRYTVQFAAWMTRGKAEQEASLLSSAGYDAFVDEAKAGGDHWYRVRIGRYDSRTQAQEIVAKLQPMTEDVVWVAMLREK